MAISEADLARWAALADTVPPGSWWLAEDGEGYADGGLFVVLVPPNPAHPESGRLPDGRYVAWQETDDPDRPELAEEADGVDWPTVAGLAWHARAAIPALVAEVRRLRAALAAQEAHSVALRDLAEALNAARDHEGEVRDAE